MDSTSRAFPMGRPNDLTNWSSQTSFKTTHMFIIKQNSSAGRGRLRQRKQGTLRGGDVGGIVKILTRVNREGGGYDEKSMNDYQSTRI